MNHPAHAEDILQFLSFLTTGKGLGRPFDGSYDPLRIYLVGHSCGAHILASIILDSSTVTPSLTPTPSLISAIKGIILSEGIYDLELLIKSFDEYRDWFILNTFSEEKLLSNFDVTKHPLRDSSNHIRWLVIHSKGDTLIDLPQSNAMFDHLSRLYASAGLSADDRVSKNLDQLEGAHNEILADSAYVEIVKDFIRV